MEYKNTTATQPASRDPLLWPFATDSIWNTPIGSDAEYIDAEIAPAGNFRTDIELFYALRETDPELPVFGLQDDEGNFKWTDRSKGNNFLNFSLPIPDELIVPDTNDLEQPNNSAAFLDSDGETLIQINALTRVYGNEHINGVRYPGAKIHTPEKIWDGTNETLTGYGEEGSHGGSGLSALGGGIRLGELTGDDPIRHALKVSIQAEYLYHNEADDIGYRWPAVSHDVTAEDGKYDKNKDPILVVDRYSNGKPIYKQDSEGNDIIAGQYIGTIPELQMGSLLAIPPGVTLESLNLETEAAKKLFYAFQDYGAYIVDEPSWNAHVLDVENGVHQEFYRQYGYDINDSGTKFFDDVMTLYSELHVVTNNGEDSVGGGGIPRAPLAPAIDSSHVADLQQLLQTQEDTFWADFNDDGHEDLLWRNLATGANQVWLLDDEGKQIGGGNTLPLRNPDWQIQGTSDVDNNNRAEIVWENLVTGATQTWHLDNIPKDPFDDPETDKLVEGWEYYWRESHLGLPTRITPIGEYGSRMDLNHQWKTVQLDNTYTNPVVIVSDPTLNGWDSLTARIQNVTSNSFQIRLQETSDQDDFHATELVSYIVMEAGDWELADGTRISAGTYDTDRLTSAGLDTVTLRDFTYTPSVLSQVQTFNESDWVTTRTHNQSANSFKVAMQEEELLNGGSHATETIGWLAVDQGVASNVSGDIVLQGGMTGRDVKSDWAVIEFEEAFSTAPSLIAKLGSYYGQNSANVRIHEIDNMSFGVRVHEDKSLDLELNHGYESVSYLALEGADGDIIGIGV